MKKSSLAKGFQQAGADLGLTVSDEIAEKMAEFYIENSRPTYQKGDLVWVYAGMGEMDWGRFERRVSQGCYVRFDGVNGNSYTRLVTNNDMRGPATQAEIDDYIRERNKPPV